LGFGLAGMLNRQRVLPELLSWQILSEGLDLKQ
jgi:hypothetical protein